MSHLSDPEKASPGWATALFNALPKLHKMGATIDLPNAIMARVEETIEKSRLKRHK